MEFETITLETDGDGIATLTLNRADRLNAFTVTMLKEMIAAFDRTDADDTVRAVIVTGSGRAFCAGADLTTGESTFDYAAQGQQRSGHMVGGVHRDGVAGARQAGGTVVVIDVLRAFTVSAYALAGGAVECRLVAEVEEARRLAECIEGSVISAERRSPAL